MAKKRIPLVFVAPGNVALGDLVRDRAGEVWIEVKRLVKENDGLLYVHGTSQSVLDGNPEVRALARECTLSWNPKFECFGRPDGDHRKKFWHVPV